MLKRTLLIIIFSMLFSLNAKSKNSFNWGADQKEIAEDVNVDPYFKNEDILGYADQTISGQPCDIWYSFYKNKLWRKVVAFYDSSDNNFENFKALLTKKYGDPSSDYKHLAWESDGTLIFLKKQANYVRIIYVNKKTLKQPYAELDKILSEDPKEENKKDKL